LKFFIQTKHPNSLLQFKKIIYGNEYDIEKLIPIEYDKNKFNLLRIIFIIYVSDVSNKIN